MHEIATICFKLKYLGIWAIWGEIWFYYTCYENLLSVHCTVKISLLYLSTVVHSCHWSISHITFGEQLNIVKAMSIHSSAVMSWHKVRTLLNLFRLSNSTLTWHLIMFPENVLPASEGRYSQWRDLLSPRNLRSPRVVRLPGQVWRLQRRRARTRLPCQRKNTARKVTPHGH